MPLKILTCLILYCLTLTGHAGTAQADKNNNLVAIAVAANFLAPIKALQKEFEVRTPYKLNISSASTGKLYAQILYGAPYHIFLAADSQRPALLEKQSRVIKDSRFPYAIGKLVLYSNRENSQDSDFASVLKQTDKFHRLAIANPRTAPYGLAAKQVLEKLSLWSPLRSKIIRAENIAQTQQFIINQQADLGLLAKSQIKGKLEGKTLGKVWEIPATLYEPIVQEAVLLPAARNHPAAQAFFNFLKSAPAREIIIHYGYLLPAPGEPAKSKAK